MSVSIVDALFVTKALGRYSYNVEHAEFAMDVYCKVCSDYTLEKYKAMQDNLMNYIATLDEAHLEAFVTAALLRLERKG